ncbi:hypothetical protein IMZ16_04840 [Cruoricaptor ignavus]|uniref:Outer membrane protein beta-barrel domain-containing protein n=1 Tax=Cruoricaptor ignavus TaxID=1118202 RepID=A0A7M1T4L6_9FLAO|nr:DUF6048 family protein [Cruoricaptor ignavus]QOR74749.1 hypothetical protein IMZ16_04840 [Cruoricaptor ignavus]
MRYARTYILLFSLVSAAAFPQNAERKKAEAFRLMAGLDVANAGISLFSDRKIFQGYVSAKVSGDIHANGEAGHEKNIYSKNGYDAEAMGPFVKLGAFYMLAKDSENDLNGFFAGANLAASFYRQHFFKIPVRGFQGQEYFLEMPEAAQSSYWVEANVGGRVQPFKSPFYIDLRAQPKYLVYSVKQENIKPMIVPGFGKSSGRFNFGFSWNLSYKF